MKNSYLRYIFFAGLAIGLGAVAYVGFLYLEPAVDISKQKTDIQLADTQLLGDFETDPALAETKYLNKVLEISGPVTKVESDSTFTKVIFDQKGKFIVVCSFADRFKEEARQIKQNQQVTVKGVYTGYVIIDDMYLIPGEIKIDQCSVAK